MKYLIIYSMMAAGLVVGLLIAPLVTSSAEVQWVISIGFGFAGSFLGKFINYWRMTPRQLIAYHCESSHLPTTTSTGDLRNFVTRLHDKGFITSLPDIDQQVFVDEGQWNELSHEEKNLFAKVTLRLFLLNDGDDLLTIASSKNKELALYSEEAGLSDSKIRHNFSMSEVQEAMKDMGFTSPSEEDSSANESEITRKTQRVDELLPMVEELRQKLATLAPNTEEHERVTFDFLTLKAEHNALRYELRGEYEPNYTITMNNTSFTHYNPKCDPESDHYDPSSPTSRKMFRKGSVYFK